MVGNSANSIPSRPGVKGSPTMNKPDFQQARAYHLTNATQVLVPGLLDTTAVGYVKATPGSKYAASYVVFHGKQSKPALNYCARTLEQAVAAVTKELNRMLASQARRAEEAAQKKATGRQVYHIDEFRGMTRRNYTTAGTAELIRQALKKAFPGQKFSVTSETFSMGSAVDVRYTDGPAYDEVRAIVEGFKSGTFNSMDDSYTYREPSGQIDESGLFFVSYGAKYVHVHREFSPGFGLWLHALDLRQPMTLADQVEAFLSWHRARCQYNDGHAWQHPATGNWLLCSAGAPEDFRRFAASLEKQGARTELDYEAHQYYLGIYQPASHCQAA